MEKSGQIANALTRRAFGTYVGSVKPFFFSESRNIQKCATVNLYTSFLSIKLYWEKSINMFRNKM